MVRDVIAGLTTGVVNMPDAMASAILAGANPISGLYALMIGTPVAELITSSVFLNASATRAIAIAAGDPDRAGGDSCLAAKCQWSDATDGAVTDGRLARAFDDVRPLARAAG